jgi:hypothetical protein
MRITKRCTFARLPFSPRVPPVPEKRIRSLLGLTCQLTCQTHDGRLIASASNRVSKNCADNIVPAKSVGNTLSILQLQRDLTLYHMELTLSNPKIANKNSIAQANLKNVSRIALCQVDFPSGIPNSIGRACLCTAKLGVDTILEILYNVGRNGAKWGKWPGIGRFRQHRWGRLTPPFALGRGPFG